MDKRNARKTDAALKKLVAEAQRQPGVAAIMQLLEISQRASETAQAGRVPAPFVSGLISASSTASDILTHSS
jgi:hypothetical protein